MSPAILSVLFFGSTAPVGQAGVQPAYEFHLLGEDIPSGNYYARILSHQGKSLLATKSDRDDPKGPAYVFTEGKSEIAISQSVAFYRDVDDDGLVLAQIEQRINGTFIYDAAILQGKHEQILGQTLVPKYLVQPECFVPGGLVLCSILNAKPDFVSHREAGHSPRAGGFLDKYNQYTLIYCDSDGVTTYPTKGKGNVRKAIGQTDMGIVVQRLEAGDAAQTWAHEGIEYFGDQGPIWFAWPDGATELEPLAASHDGHYVSGTALFSRNQPQPYGAIWEDGKLLEAPGNDSKADFILSISRAAKLGTGYMAQGSKRLPIVWTPSKHFQPLADYFADQHIQVPKDWTILTIGPISDDGDTIAGSVSVSGKPVRPFLMTRKKDQPVGG